jgi:hypothetical protein
VGGYIYIIKDIIKFKKMKIKKMKIKKNGQVIRLTESDLQRIVKRVLAEGENSDGYGFENTPRFENTPPESLSQRISAKKEKERLKQRFMFTDTELQKIKDNAIRLSAPGFFDEDEIEFYLRYDVAKENPQVFRSLIGWLKGEYPYFNSGAFSLYDSLDGDNDYWK